MILYTQYGKYILHPIPKKFQTVVLLILDITGYFVAGNKVLSHQV